MDAEVDAGTRPGTKTAEQAEIKALKAKIRRLEEDNRILHVNGKRILTPPCAAKGSVFTCRRHPVGITDVTQGWVYRGTAASPARSSVGVAAKLSHAS